MSSQFTLIDVSLPDGTSSNVSVANGTISAIGSQVEGEAINCAGLFASPGFVDLHTHLRQPGFEDSETVLTGSRSGVAGGYTALLAMANTNPVADNPSVVNQVRQLGINAGLLQVQPVASITKGLQGEELSPMLALMRSAAEVRYFSDDGVCVWNRRLMREALDFSSKFPVVIAQHAQDPHLTEGSQMNDGALADDLGLAGWPAVAEESVIASDVQLALATGGRLHICHLTTGAGLDVVRWAKSKGIRVSAEVTPHHLLLTEQLVSSYDSTYKVNPPLRTDEDVAALRAGIIDGSIDAIATDHAPHSREKKECEWQNAAFGMVGLETAASVAQLVLDGSGPDWRARYVQVLSTKPAEIAQLEGQGSLRVGSRANITLVDLSATRKIERATNSKSVNNPFFGQKLPGQVIHTIFQGEFSVRDGAIQIV